MTELCSATCPYCGEPVEIVVDTGGSAQQEYVEDCPVCCRPWLVRVEQSAAEVWTAILSTSDD